MLSPRVSCESPRRGKASTFRTPGNNRASTLQHLPNLGAHEDCRPPSLLWGGLHVGWLGSSGDWLGPKRLAVQAPYLWGLKE